jgi:hypothetical protein
MWVGICLTSVGKNNGLQNLTEWASERKKGRNRSVKLRRGDGPVPAQNVMERVVSELFLRRCARDVGLGPVDQGAVTQPRKTQRKV